MSLVTSTAFQVSPAVQTRSFVVLGTLATTDVDDDFLYQILVAFNTALGKANETHTMSVVSMLRCMCKIVPALTESSRYVPLLFWLAVSLLQASHFAFYVESTRLVRVTLETMEQRGMFKKEGVQSVLLESRIQLEQITSQLDDILKISFESSFSFSLASIIFKGIRHSGLKDSAEAVLRSLLSVAVRSQANDDLPSGFRDSISADALGYFLALLPLSTTHPSYRRLLDDCNIDDAWLPDAGLESIDEDEYGTPRISPAFLGINDSSTALLVTTFVGTMLTTAQGDDKETEILCSLLSDIASYFPQTVAMAYVSAVFLFCLCLRLTGFVQVRRSARSNQGHVRQLGQRIHHSIYVKHFPSRAARKLSTGYAEELGIHAHRGCSLRAKSYPPECSR